MLLGTEGFDQPVACLRGAELREPSDVAIEDWLLKRLGTKLKSLSPEGSGSPQKASAENPGGL